MGWNALAQVLPVAIQFFVTPYLLVTLGSTRYGESALGLAILGTLSILDLGVASSALRFLSLVKDSREETAEVLAVTSTILVATVGVVSIVGFAISAPLARSLAKPGMNAHDLGLFIRCLMIVLTLGAANGVLQSLLQAHGNWRNVSFQRSLTTGIYAVVACLLASRGDGILSIGYAVVVSQLFALIILGSSAIRYVNVRYFRLKDLRAITKYLRYSASLQLITIGNYFNIQADALIVGAFLPVRYVGYYSIGANVAYQARSLPLNAIPPLVTRWSVCFVKEGLAATLNQFVPMQRLWVRSAVGFAGIAAVGAWFAVPEWLPYGQGRAVASVACILLAGHAILLSTAAKTALLRAIGRPGIEVRYGLLMIAANIAATVPLTLAFGLYGVALGTSIGECVGAIYFERLASRNSESRTESIFKSVPWLSLPIAAGSLWLALTIIVRQVRGDRYLALAFVVVIVLGTLGIYAFAPTLRRRLPGQQQDQISN